MARWQGKTWFLTYSRCSASKEELRDALKVRLGTDKVRYILVCSEKHKDGFPHLHVLVQLVKPLDFTSSSYFDLCKVHPSFEKAKDNDAARTYIKKDGDWIEEGDLALVSKKKMKLTNKELLEGDLVEMVETDKVSLYVLPALMNCRKLFTGLKKRQLPDLGSFLPSGWKGLDLPVYSGKQKHYWLYSSMPNRGKTTFLKSLSEVHRTSWYSCNEKYQDILEDSQVLLFDEYSRKNWVYITILNTICDGTYKFPKKGANPIVLVNPIVIICSNYSINELYTEGNDRVHARFIEICLDNY